MLAANFFGPNELFRNEGGGEFVEVHGTALSSPMDTQSAAWADFDGDGDLDVLLGNSNGPNELLRNDGGWAEGKGSFTALSISSHRTTLT